MTVAAPELPSYVLGDGIDLPTYIIEVTPDDIRFGLPGIASNCAVARAVRRVTGYEADVEGDAITLWPTNEAHIDYLGPSWLNSWVDRFDHHDTVDPITFDLTPRW